MREAAHCAALATRREIDHDLRWGAFPLSLSRLRRLLHGAGRLRRGQGDGLGGEWRGSGRVVDRS